MEKIWTFFVFLALAAFLTHSARIVTHQDLQKLDKVVLTWYDSLPHANAAPASKAKQATSPPVVTPSVHHSAPSHSQPKTPSSQMPSSHPKNGPHPQEVSHPKAVPHPQEASHPKEPAHPHPKAPSQRSSSAPSHSSNQKGQSQASNHKSSPKVSQSVQEQGGKNASQLSLNFPIIGHIVHSIKQVASMATSDTAEDTAATKKNHAFMRDNEQDANGKAKKGSKDGKEDHATFLKMAAQKEDGKEDWTGQSSPSSKDGKEDAATKAANNKWMAQALEDSKVVPIKNDTEEDNGQAKRMKFMMSDPFASKQKKKDVKADAAENNKMGVVMGDAAEDDLGKAAKGSKDAKEDSKVDPVLLNMNDGMADYHPATEPPQH